MNRILLSLESFCSVPLELLNFPLSDTKISSIILSQTFQSESIPQFLDKLVSQGISKSLSKHVTVLKLHIYNWNNT